MTLTLAEATSIVAAAIAKARQLNVTVSVAVCDEQGHLIALNRMDGAYAEIANRFSIGKAIVSASTGLPSGEVKGTVDHPSAAGVLGQGMPAIRIRGDCRSSETGKSRVPAAWAEHYPTSTRRSARAPGLPASYADAGAAPSLKTQAAKVDQSFRHVGEGSPPVARDSATLTRPR